MLNSVLLDWNEEKFLEILRNCRRAMGEEAKLLVMERVVPEKLSVSAADQSVARSDLTMLVALAARERTEGEFANLLKQAGFRMNRIIPGRVMVSIIEAFPV